jgi:hypothetical protein
LQRKIGLSKYRKKTNIRKGGRRIYIFNWFESGREYPPVIRAQGLVFWGIIDNR